MENIIKRRVNLLVVPFLALIVLLIFSFGVSAEEPLIKLVTESGEEIPCYDEPVTAENGTVTHHLYLTVPETEDNQLTYNVKLVSTGTTYMSFLQLCTIDGDGKATVIKNQALAANKNGTIDTSKLKSKYESGDERYRIQLAISSWGDAVGYYYLYVTPLPSVKSFNTEIISNYVGNHADCAIGAVFENVENDTPVKIYITSKENGTSENAEKDTLVETTVSQVKSNFAETGTVSVPTSELKAGKYWIGIEVGESRQYQEFNMYATAREYAEAAQKLFVKWYQTKGFVKNGEYLGLSADTGNGSGIDWEAYIFGALGYDANDSLLTSSPNLGNSSYLDLKASKFKNATLESLTANQGSVPASKILGRQILGIAGLGGDPRNIGGANLVEALISLAYKDHDIAGGELNLDEDGSLRVRLADMDTIAEAYFLLALEVVNATPEEGYTEELRAAGLKTIINAWKDIDLSEATNVSDFYSMTLFACEFLNDVEGMEGEAQKLLDAFRKNYTSVIANGIYMNEFSIAVATTTVVSAGVTLDEYGTDDPWIGENGQSALFALLCQQNADGGMGQYDTRMASYEVLQGLADLLNGKTCFRVAHETYMENYPQYSDDYLAGKAVEKQIDAIGEVTKESKGAIEEARAAYDALTEEQKGFVENLDTLTAAEKALQALLDKAAAKAVDEKIAAIGEVTKNSKGAIEAARSAYNALTAGQKELVTKLDVLIAAEKAYADLTAKLPFTDLKDGAWYMENVRYAYLNGIIVGMTDTTFAPDSELTRAMYITMLYRMSGEPEVKAGSAYDDVKGSEWYAKAVAWGTEKGIVVGYAGKFAPQDNITREQMAAMMYRYAKLNGCDVSNTASFDAFKDGNTVSDWAKKEMGWAVASKLIQGHDNGTLEPKGNATRAQAAAVLQRFDENILN